MSKQLQLNPRYLVTAILFLLTAPTGFSQTTTSPYSILGIGDIETGDISRYFISGGNGISRRDPATYNSANPASLSSLPLKTLSFDLAFRGRYSSFKIPGETLRSNVSKDFTIKRIGLAFKPTEKTGIAFGLKPYSTVNYQFQQTETILDGNTSILEYIEGSGGINQFYLSAGKSFSTKFSAGITASFLFGSLQRNTSFYSSDLNLSIVKENRDYYNGTLLQGAVQYNSAGKKWTHTIGATASVSSGLKGQLTTDYIDADETVKTTVEDNRHFKLPLSTGIGYTATYKNSIRISVAAHYQYWKTQQLDYHNSYSSPAWRLSAGMEFLFNSSHSSNPDNKPYLGFGVHAENTYLKINNQTLPDRAFSFGGGFQLFRNVSTYGGIELGIKGDANKGQIRESYTQFVWGITLKDIWVGAKKYGRYR